MPSIIIEGFLGAMLLFVSTKRGLRELGEALHLLLSLLPRRSTRTLWINCQVPKLLRLVVGAVGTACFLDPLIGGAGNLAIRAPAEVPTTMENLRVRVTPIGVLGEAGGDQIAVASFDKRGLASVSVSFRFLQVNAMVQVFDRTQNEQPPIAQKIVYVSPFVRRQLLSLMVIF